jgi:hypothetical protein
MKNENGFAITKILIILASVVVIIGGVVYFLLDDKEEETISVPVIPAECQSFQDDACGLFACMMKSCWCNDLGPESPILYETYITIDDEQGAKDAVYAYIAELIHGDNELAASEEAKKMKIKNVIKLNAVFYNVFVDKEGEEIVYTVSKDGQILATICGI